MRESSLEKLCKSLPEIEKPVNKKQIYSAGILPFYVKNETIYFLLGKDKDNCWSDFGGRVESKDEGRWDLTAVREFYEESVGSILDISHTLSLLQNKKICLRLKGKTLNKNPYYMYFLKIPFKNCYRENFKSTLKFINYTHLFEKKYNEKIDIQWVSMETLNISLTDTQPNYPLRKVFKDTLTSNIDKIVSFGSQFYEREMIMFKKSM